ncbi:MAG TPA: NAD-dependent epimerase/dehydratase family protein, partial [Stellaceae bacterium]|nr:NAD-dependent epimerase/dehydratase family protein [Stellaceae bacterium]
RSKAAGEAALRAVRPDAIILRPSIVFGPEDDFFNRFAGYARVLPILPLIGGGTTRFQPVYVRDVASAAVAALILPEAQGRIYELAGPRVLTFKELMELILEVTRRSPPLINVPVSLAAVKAWFLEFLPKPPLTRDQLRMMERDNVPASGMPGLAALGIEPNSLEAILPTYLERFRHRGLWRPRTT